MPLDRLNRQSDDDYEGLYKFQQFDFKRQKEVVGDINISHGPFTSLMGLPQKLFGNLNCSYCPLKTLIGDLKKIRGDLDCSNTDISTLYGTPDITQGELICKDCKNIKSLNGCPQKIMGLICCGTNIKDLHGVNNAKGSPLRCIDCSRCELLSSISGCPKELDLFGITYSPKVFTFNKDTLDNDKSIILNINGADELKYVGELEIYADEHLLNEIKDFWKKKGQNYNGFALGGDFEIGNKITLNGIEIPKADLSENG